MTPMDSIEQVGSLAHMMHEYGPFIVILSVFLMLFIVILLYIIKQQQATQEKIMNEHRDLIQNLLDRQMKEDLAKANLNNSNHINSSKFVLQEHLRISNAIRVEVSKSVAFLKATRIAIYSLHNGTASISGLPFLKFSCISEYVVQSTDSCIKQHTNFPVNFMCDLLEDMVDHKDIVYYDENNLAVSPNKLLVDMLLANRSSKYIFRGIFDSSATLIAFIVVEFDINGLDSNNYQDKSTVLDGLISRISPILEYSKFSDTYSKVVQNNET